MEYPVTYPTGEPHKVHHSYIWLGPLSAAAAMLFALLVYNISSIIQLYEFLQERGLASGLLVVVGAIVAFLVVYAIITLVYVLAWRNMRYVFDDTEFSLYSGIITKRQVHVPYARVQSVNHRASLVQRIFGVCTVSIDTAGGASNKAVRVPYVTLADAERIRIDLFVRKAAVEADRIDAVRLVDMESQAQLVGMQQAGIFDTAAQRASAPVSPQELESQRAAAQAQQAQPGALKPNMLDDAAQQVSSWRGAFGGSSVEAPAAAGQSAPGGAPGFISGMEPVSFEAGLSNAQLLLTGTTALGTESAVVTLGITGVLLGIMANSALIEPWLVGLGALIAIGMLLLGAVVGVVGTMVSYGNFRVRRRGSRIEVERGLLQRVFSGIDIERVQSVVVRQSFIRRCMGYCEVSLGRISAASGESSSQQNKQALNQNGLVVHPFMKLEDVQPFLAQLLPEYADMPTKSALAPLPAVALRRGLLRQGIWRNPMLWTSLGYAVVQAILHIALGRQAALGSEASTGLAVLDQMGLVLYTFSVAYTLAVLVNAKLWKGGSGHALARRYLAVRNDGLHTDFTVIPRAKIQSGCTRTNPFQRSAGVTTLVASTAAGSRSTHTGRSGT